MRVMQLWIEPTLAITPQLAVVFQEIFVREGRWRFISRIGLRFIEKLLVAIDAAEGDETGSRIVAQESGRRTIWRYE